MAHQHDQRRLHLPGRTIQFWQCEALVSIFRNLWAGPSIHPQHPSSLHLRAVGQASAPPQQLAQLGHALASRRISSRAAGFTRAEISAILLGEQAVQIAIAIPLGLVLGTLGAKALIASWADPEIFRIPFIISDQTYAFSVAVVLASGIASALLVRRKLDRLDLIAVLKTRE